MFTRLVAKFLLMIPPVIWMYLVRGRTRCRVASSGNVVRVCAVSSDASMVPSSALLDDVVGTGPKDGIGEIVLAGVQLDSLSGYWKAPDLSTGRLCFFQNTRE